MPKQQPWQAMTEAGEPGRRQLLPPRRPGHTRFECLGQICFPHLYYMSLFRDQAQPK